MGGQVWDHSRIKVLARVKRREQNPEKSWVRKPRGQSKSRIRNKPSQEIRQTASQVEKSGA